MKFEPGNNSGRRFQPGQSGNPGGRRRSIQSLIRGLAAERGLDENLAGMALNALVTGVLIFEPFEAPAKSKKVVRIERAKLAGLKHPTGRVTIDSIGEWIGLVRFVYPHADEGGDATAESTLLGFATALRERIAERADSDTAVRVVLGQRKET